MQLDLRRPARRRRVPRTPALRDAGRRTRLDGLLAALATALFVSLLYFAIALLRVLDGTPLAAGEQLLVLAWSLLSHLVLFLGVAAVFVLLLAFARLTRVPARTELALSALLVCTAVFFAVRDVVFRRRVAHRTGRVALCCPVRRRRGRESRRGSALRTR